MFVCVCVSLDAFPSNSFGNAHLDMTRLDSPLVVFFPTEYHLNVGGVVKARRPQISLTFHVTVVCSDLGNTVSMSAGTYGRPSALKPDRQSRS